MGEHPLADRGRLERLWWLLHATVQRALGFTQRPTTTDPALPGGVSADDVATDALIELLKLDPRVVESYEAPGVDIARKRAIDALKRARVGSLLFESLDVTRPVDSELQLQNPAANVELIALTLEQERLLWRASMRLPRRDREIFYRIFFRGETKSEVARSLRPPLTSQRVGQIFAALVLRLYREISGEDPEGGSSGRRSS